MAHRVDVIPGVQVPAEQPKIQRYVAGFAFDESCRVLLLRKKVPRWQAGLLNGVGGKIEDGETPNFAMSREFSEETGVDVAEPSWRCFCVESGADYEVHFFKTHLSYWEADRAASRGVNDVGEELRWYFLHVIGNQHHEMIGNLQWLIPMALDWRDFQARLTVKGEISGRPTWPTSGR